MLRICVRPRWGRRGLLFIMVYKPCIPLGYENCWPYGRQRYYDVYWKIVLQTWSLCRFSFRLIKSFDALSSKFKVLALHKG